jgi:hypothetical protein
VKFKFIIIYKIENECTLFGLHGKSEEYVNFVAEQWKGAYASLEGEESRIERTIVKSINLKLL